ncbi:MAG: response regulator transcription factor [Candidatus Sulfotelmatobacter sp.]
MPSMPQQVAIFGLDRLFYEIVASAISGHGWQVLDFASNHIQSNRPDVVLTFASGGSESILQTVGEARAEFSDAKIVLLGAQAGDSEIIRYIEAGVRAYVVGGQSFGDLINTLQMVRNNQTPSFGRVTQLVLGDISRLTRQRGADPLPRLTQREIQILHLVDAGLGNKEIADHLGITANTVKNHVHHILEKLKVKNRHEASWLKSRLRQGFPIAG